MSGRTPEGALVAALTRYLGTMRGLRHSSTDWHSATFSGARHALTFALDDNADTAERLREIAETDLPLVCGFVADVALASLTSGEDGLLVELDVLTIAD